MEKRNMLLLVVFCLVAAFLNFLPHLDYNYPLHVDEWVHFQYSNNLSSGAPRYFGESGLNLEYGFHLILALLNSFGISYLEIFRFFPAIFTVFICLVLFITVRKIFNEEAAVFSVLGFCFVKSSVSVLGPMFLVPLSVGIFFILIGIYFLEIKSNLFFLPLAALLIIHPPSALAYFLIINIKIVLGRKDILKKIGLEIVALLIALPLYFNIFILRGFSSLNYLSFTVISSPLFIPRFFGYAIVIFGAIGIYFSVLKKRYDLILYSIIFLIFVGIFYYFRIEFFLPYRRVLFYLFLIFLMFFGFGFYNVVELVRNKKLIVIWTIILICLVIFVSLPVRIDNSNEVYNVIDDSDYRAFVFMRDNLGGGIVLTDPWIANALTPIAEKEVFSRIVQGPNEFYEARNNEVNKFLSEKCGDSKFLAENKISFVYSRNGCNNSDLVEVYPKVYSLRSESTNLG